MARGWESKSVDDQIAAREETQVLAPEMTADERTRRARRETLAMARARALQDLQHACDRRHRALLEQTIRHLDAQLRDLE